MKLSTPLPAIIALIIFVMSCSNGNPSQDSQSALSTAGNQPDKNLRILFRWPGDDFATKQELETRDKIARAITEKQIGRVIRFGTGMGWMDIVIAVEEKDSAQRSIEKIIMEMSPESKFSFR